jgi:hypothetical protein
MSCVQPRPYHHLYLQHSPANDARLSVGMYWQASDFQTMWIPSAEVGLVPDVKIISAWVVGIGALEVRVRRSVGKQRRGMRM